LQRKIDPNGKSLFLAHLTKSSRSFFNPKLNYAKIFIVGKTVGETDTLVHCWWTGNWYHIYEANLAVPFTCFLTQILDFFRIYAIVIEYMCKWHTKHGYPMQCCLQYSKTGNHEYMPCEDWPVNHRRGIKGNTV
jgi:hypothetical protein